jgi:hypothetical protein
LSATDLEERTLLDNRFGSGTPATWFIGLSTTAPADDGSGATEPSGGAYARVSVTNNTTNFPAAATASGTTTKSNGTEIVFAQATAGWGTITHVLVWDATSAGNLRYSHPLNTTVTVNTGDVARFQVGLLKFTMD